MRRELLSREQYDHAPTCPHELLRHREILGHAIAHPFVAAECGVRIASYCDELPVRDDVLGTFRVADVLRATVAPRDQGEHLRLDDTLPEAVHLLMTRDAQQVGVSIAHRVDRARQKVGCVLCVGVGEDKQFSARF